MLRRHPTCWQTATTHRMFHRCCLRARFSSCASRAMNGGLYWSLPRLAADRCRTAEGDAAVYAGVRLSHTRRISCDHHLYLCVHPAMVRPSLRVTFSLVHLLRCGVPCLLTATAARRWLGELFAPPPPLPFVARSWLPGYRTCWQRLLLPQRYAACGRYVQPRRNTALAFWAGILVRTGLNDTR